MKTKGRRETRCWISTPESQGDPNDSQTSLYVKGTNEGQGEGEVQPHRVQPFAQFERYTYTRVHTQGNRGRSEGKGFPCQISPKQTVARGRLDLFSRLMYG